MTRIQRPQEQTGIIPYEQRLDEDFNWALLEGSMHFDKANAVHTTLRRIARKLDEIGIPYAVAGGMAAFYHGYRRFTEDVDIIVTQDGLRIIHENLEGRGYLPPFRGSKHLRDTESGVRVEFLISGTYPGDGKPKPVAFPDPASASVVIDGIRFLAVERLVELKIVSGSMPGRRRDWGDVQELIRTLGLARELAQKLDRSVQDAYQMLWDEVQQTPEPP